VHFLLLERSYQNQVITGIRPEILPE
jgi:hypothetical protein